MLKLLSLQLSTKRKLLYIYTKLYLLAGKEILETMKTDLSYLREMSGGNTELVLEMIDIFSNQVVEFASEMDDLLKSENYELLGKLAHKAKSSVSIMGLNDLALELKQLENNARERKNPSSYPVIVEKFKQETAEAVKELIIVAKNIELYF